jgi:hypothetical protein
MIGPTTVPVILLLTLGAEFAAGRVRAFLERNPPWTTALARLLGGAALIGLSFWFHLLEGFPFIHPIPLSPFSGEPSPASFARVLRHRSVRTGRGRGLPRPLPALPS